MMKATKYGNKEVIIYGAGMIGKRLLGQFKDNGINVSFFLDKRGDVIKSFGGKNVYSLDEIKVILDKKEEYVIFVAIKNVFQHTEIVKKLINIGFTYFIFKPLPVLQGCEVCKELKLIDEIYEKIVEQEGFILRNIPSSRDFRLIEVKDWAFIEENNRNVKAYIPSELICTNYNPDNLQWSKKNMLACYVAIDMYHGFKGNGRSDNKRLVQEYISKIARPGAIKVGMNIDGKWEEGVIEGRHNVYHEMSRRLALQPTFFIDNCPFVKRQSDNTFVLLSSGKNRISFLIAQGLQYIPVEMSKDDYQEYLNFSKAQKVLDYLISHDSEQLLAPIPHPYFYYWDVLASGYIEQWIESIAKFLSRWLYACTNGMEYSKERIVVILSDQGCSSRYFSTVGYSVVAYDAISNKLCDVLNELLFSTYRIVHSLDEINQKFNILLLDTKRIEEFNDFKIIELCNLFCFILVREEDILILKRMEKYGFYAIHRFFGQYWGQEYVEGYILVRDENPQKYLEFFI